MTRVEQIQERLERAFAPCSVVVTDDSAAHVGHDGAKDGGGHFHVLITSPSFRGLSILERHRAIYAALGTMMNRQIHALSIDARLPPNSVQS